MYLVSVDICWNWYCMSRNDNFIFRKSWYNFIFIYLILYCFIGVIGAIVLWNFFLMLLIWKIVLVLVMGNIVVLKSVIYIRLLVFLLVEVCAEVGLLFGVFNVVIGSGVMGSMLVEYFLVDKVVFIGLIGVSGWIG